MRCAGYVTIIRVAILVLSCFPGSQSATGQEKLAPINFAVSRRPAGEAPKPREVKSADGKLVLKVQPDKTVRLFETDSGSAIGPSIELEEKGHLFVISALAISPSGKRIATAIGNDDDSGEVDVWDASTGKRIAQYNGSLALGTVFSVSFSRSGNTVSIVSGPAGGK